MAMIRSRFFVLGLSVTSAGAALVSACGDGELRASLIEGPDAAGAPEAPPPADQDDGILDAGADADTGTSKPDYDASDEPVVCTTTPCVTQLVAGSAYFCALFSDGSIRCWGRDSQGSLGRGADAGNPTGTRPAPVVGITNATQVSASSLGYATCARLADGRVQCWGENTNAQLGLRASPVLRDGVSRSTPADVAISTELARVDVGPASACALATNGDLYCWGNNTQRLLGRADAGATFSDGWSGPAVVDGENDAIRRIAIGYKTAFALTNDHQLVSWGAVTGRLSSLLYTQPSVFEALSDVTSVATGGRSAETTTQCIVASGSVYCWGSNGAGALGTGFPDDERLPRPAKLVTDGTAFPQQLALSQSTTCVRMTDGTIQCCGVNKLGQLGTDAGTTAWVFVPAARFQGRAVQVAVATNTTCALVQGGEVVCWGGNANGELGQGTSDSEIHSDPVTVIFD